MNPSRVVCRKVPCKNNGYCLSKVEKLYTNGLAVNFEVDSRWCNDAAPCNQNTAAAAVAVNEDPPSPQDAIFRAIVRAALMVGNESPERVHDFCLQIKRWANSSLGNERSESKNELNCL